MGEINTVSGTRGYAPGNLMAGCGMAGPDWCREMAVCSHCCQVVPAVTGGGDVAAVLLDTPCPRCGEEAMRLTDTGVWD